MQSNRRDQALPEVREELEAMGFNFERSFRQPKWCANFEKLKTYKEKNGNCDLRALSQKDNKLYRWITGRIQGRAGPEEQEELKTLGVQIDAKKGREVDARKGRKTQMAAQPK